MRLFIPVYLSVLILADAAPAQERSADLEGRVVSETGAPVPQAVVSLPSGRQAVLTGRDGRFRLGSLPSGALRLHVRAMGFEPVQREVTAEDRRGEIEIVLAPTPLALPGIDVTATPSGRDPMTIAQPTTRLAGRDLERALGGTLAQTLEGQPGISVRYNGPAASLPVIRGLTGDRILVLQDGRRAGDLSGSAEDHALTIDPMTAQRVEVVRGPASLLYGSNALGGVINVISAELQTDGKARGSWVGGVQTESAFPGGTASVRGQVPLGGGWSGSARGGMRVSGDARIAGAAGLGERLENSFHTNRHAAGAVGYASERVSGGVLVEAYAMRHGVPLPPEEEDEIVLEGRKLGASARLDLRTGRKDLSAVRLQMGVTGYSHEELEGEEVQMAFGLRTLTADLLVRQDARGAFREGAWGLGVLGRGHVATGEEQLTAPADARSLAAFTFQEVNLGRSGASLQVGGRVERYGIVSHDDLRFGAGRERSFTALAGSVGMVMPLAAGVNAGLSAARSFRAPAVEELFSSALHIGTASFEIGNPGLSPEVAEGLDAVLRVRRSRWTGEMAMYVSDIHGFIHFEERGDTILDGESWPVLAYVQGGARFRGVEAGLEWMPAPRIVLGLRGDVVRASLSGGTPVPFTPPARVAASARREAGPFTVGGGIRHGRPQRRVGLAQEPPTHAYTLLDLHLGWRWVAGERVQLLQLRAENLTNASYRDAASRVKSFAPNPGRNISLLYRVSL
jgi:iron complex outermembrane recepter protein